MDKGLYQGDLLSNFLFFLVMEVLTCMMNKEVDRGYFRSFKINKEEDVNILQFTDDTIIMAQGCSDNLWSMKAILRGFEMMLGLKVNFYKSKTYGIHVGQWFLNVASVFLSCKTDILPFKFLGVKVGDSTKKIVIWKDAINQFKSILEVWKGRHLTMVGQVVLINQVLNEIFIYSLFFYKAPPKSCKRFYAFKEIFYEVVARTKGWCTGCVGRLFVKIERKEA